MPRKSPAKIILLAFALFLASGCTSNSAAQAASVQSGPSLYKRLGGYDAIAAVSDDFIGRLAADKQLSRFLVGMSADSQKRLRQHVVDQLCQATGGPCIYTGRPMKTAHAGLGITESDWQLTVKHLVASLDKFKVPEKEKNEFLALASSLKPDIVEK
jgi:hemoglobin